MNKETFLNLLFPRRCPVCGEITEPAGSLICQACFPRLSFVKSPVCKVCGKEIGSAVTEYCKDCARRPRSFEYGAALLNYDETAAKSMANIKYHNKREYLDFYGAAMAARFGKTVTRMKADALVPVPVHRSRKRFRGFNQAQVLAEILGKKLGLPVYPDMLVRTKKTLPQKNLSAAERLRNLSAAVSPGMVPKGVRAVILVDDIYTTGSTMEACARALKRAGVEQVYFLAVCVAGGQ